MSNNIGGGQFGDTSYTKVFVGGLAWETHKETMKNYFEQFGEILEAVVIFDKISGRSKGYGFVTFKEAEAARRACVDPAPVIDGRRANCNLASLGVQRSTRPSTPQHGCRNFGVMKSYQTTGYQQGGVGTPFPSTPTLPHYAIQQGIPCALYGYSPYSPSYTCPTTYYSACGGTSSHYLVYGNGTVSNSNFYPYMQYGLGLGLGLGLDYQYPQQHFQYPIIASSGVHPHLYTPPISYSQPAGARVNTGVVAPTVGPNYPCPISSI